MTLNAQTIFELTFVHKRLLPMLCNHLKNEIISIHYIRACLYTKYHQFPVQDGCVVTVYVQAFFEIPLCVR